MNLIPVEYQGERILTTEQLARIYECKAENLQDNHRKNPERFMEGKHYFKLEGDELKNFKQSLPENFREPLKYASQLILWTKRGASRHCKMLGTDKAWEQFDALEESYFSPRSPALCMEDMLIAQLQQMKELRLKQERMEAEQLRQARQIEEIEARVETSPRDYYSVAGYASLRGVKVDVNRARMFGMRAAKLSRKNGYGVGRVRDPRFGEVNTYHLDILKEVFGAK